MQKIYQATYRTRMNQIKFKVTVCLEIYAEKSIYDKYCTFDGKS